MCADVHQHVLENMTTAVILLDRSLCVHWLNPAAETLLGVSLARIQHASLRSIIEHTDMHDMLAEALVRQHPYTQREAVLSLTHGESLTVDYTATPTSNDLLLVEMECRDRLMRILREEELLSRQERVKTLTRGLAHEIKNPLGGIRGSAQLLARHLPTPEQKEFTRVIIEEVDRLKNLVDRMLGPNQVLHYQPLNIHVVLERVAALIDADTSPEFARIKLIKDYDPSLPLVIGDEAQLIQAVLNVARNAMQAMSEHHTPDACLTLRSRARRQFTLNDRHRLVCEVSIVDNGPGVPEALHESLFYPMMSGRPAGTGLGLSIAQSIMHQHQGLIECDSRPGQTLFHLLIPLDVKSR